MTVLMNVTMHCICQINSHKPNNLHLMKFVKSLEKKKCSATCKKKLELAMSIIDDIIPFVSGRNYRIQKMSNKELYRRYVEQVKIRGVTAHGTHKPCSISFIRKWILRKENIHHSKDQSICPTCLLLEQYGHGEPMPDSFKEKEVEKATKNWNKQHPNTPFPADKLAQCVAGVPEKWKRKLEKYKDHHQRIKDQFRAYKQTKTQLAKGELQDTILVLQDFTQLSKQSGFNQDLIITIIGYDPSSKDKLRTTFHHFIADDEKNNIYFVFAVWEYILGSTKIQQATTPVKNIVVWSDGGPKHFKVSDTLFYFSTIKKRYNINISYNFYESHHGHNACDAAAAHAKRQISSLQLDKGIPVYKSSQLVEEISKVKNHVATTLKEIAKTVSVNISEQIDRVKGIKSYYKFEFGGDGEIKAYLSSLSYVCNKVYTIAGEMSGLWEQEVVEEGRIIEQ